MNHWNFLTGLIWPAFWVVFIIIFRVQIKEILGSLKKLLDKLGKLKKFSYRDLIFEMDQDTIITPQADTSKTTAETKDLSIEIREVLSTLWKHQQERFPDDPLAGRWSFVVGGGSHFADFLMGVGGGIKKRLIAFNPMNGQFHLTEAGIKYCQENKDQILPEWDYEKWKS